MGVLCVTLESCLKHSASSQDPRLVIKDKSIDGLLRHDDGLLVQTLLADIHNVRHLTMLLTIKKFIDLLKCFSICLNPHEVKENPLQDVPYGVDHVHLITNVCQSDRHGKDRENAVTRKINIHPLSIHPHS